MKRLQPYFVPTIILICGISCILTIAYYNFDFFWEKEKSITFLLSGLGLIFAIFQVVLNINIQQTRNLATLRHTEYKELIKLLNGISDLMNTGMLTDIKAHTLVSSLMNKQNEFISFVKHNNTYLFQGIQDNNILKETLYIIEELTVRTDKYRFGIDEIAKLKQRQVGDNHYEVMEVIDHIDWHNDIKEVLNRYNNLKHQALSEIQKYIT
jgi:hypothetical protein